MFTPLLPAALNQLLTKSLIYGALLPQLMSKFTRGAWIGVSCDKSDGSFTKTRRVYKPQKTETLTFALVSVLIQNGLG